LNKKKKLIRNITELLCNELGKNSLTTIVVIEEIQTGNWGIDGKSVTQRRGQ